MLRLVNLDLMSVQYRESLMKNEKLISENFGIYKPFAESLMVIIEKKAKYNELLEGKWALVILDKPFGSLRRLDPATDSLIPMHKFCRELQNNRCTAVSIGEHIFALMDDKSCFRLKFTDRKAVWKKMASMNTDHGWHPPGVVSMGFIIVMGGCHDFCRSVEKYDIIENTWTRLKDKTNPLEEVAILSCNEYVYNFGGEYDRIPTNVVQRFHMPTSQWSDIAPMKRARCAPTLVRIEECVYVSGGWNERTVSVAECYNIATNQWTDMPGVLSERGFVDIIAGEGTVYILSDNTILRQSVEDYRAQKNVWETIQFSGKKLNIESCVEIKLDQ